MLHKWNRKTNAIETMNACKGHKRSVDCVAVDPTKSFVASGSYDAQVKAEIHQPFQMSSSLQWSFWCIICSFLPTGVFSKLIVASRSNNETQ